MILALLFQLQGFSDTSTWPALFGAVTLHGPSSMTRPVKEEHPGPEGDISAMLHVLGRETQSYLRLAKVRPDH